MLSAVKLRLALCRRRSGSLATIHVTLVLLVGSLAGCAATEPHHPPVELRYPEEGMSELGKAGVRSAARSYVKVTIQQRAGSSTGKGNGAERRVINGASGIIVHPDGYVVTAAHIARKPSFEARVTTLDGKEHAASIVRVDAGLELGLLKIRNAHGSFVAAAAADNARAKQPIFAIGTPGGRPGAVATGYVIQPRLYRSVGHGDFSHSGPVSLALKVAPGYSGGPVFDNHGRLVGMIYAFDLRANANGEPVNTGTAYAVPAKDVMRFLRRQSPGNISSP